MLKATTSTNNSPNPLAQQLGFALFRQDTITQALKEAQGVVADAENIIKKEWAALTSESKESYAKKAKAAAVSNTASTNSKNLLTVPQGHNNEAKANMQGVLSWAQALSYLTPSESLVGNPDLPFKANDKVPNPGYFQNYHFYK